MPVQVTRYTAAITSVWDSGTRGLHLSLRTESTAKTAPASRRVNGWVFTSWYSSAFWQLCAFTDHLQLDVLSQYYEAPFTPLNPPLPFTPLYPP